MDKNIIVKIKKLIKKFKMLRIRSNLILIMRVYTVIFLAIPVIFGVINLQGSIEQGKHSKLWSVFVLFMIGFYFFVMRSFKKNIYTPIVMVEKVVQGIVLGKRDLDIAQVREGDALYPLYCDLNVKVPFPILVSNPW